MGFQTAGSSRLPRPPKIASVAAILKEIERRQRADDRAIGSAGATGPVSFADVDFAGICTVPVVSSIQSKSWSGLSGCSESSGMIVPEKAGTYAVIAGYHLEGPIGMVALASAGGILGIGGDTQVAAPQNGADGYGSSASVSPLSTSAAGGVGVAATADWGAVTPDDWTVTITVAGFRIK